MKVATYLKHHNHKLSPILNTIFNAIKSSNEMKLLSKSKKSKSFMGLEVHQDGAKKAKSSE